MTVSLVKLAELHKQTIFVFLFALFVIPTVKCTCNPTLVFNGVLKEEELLPITDMATRHSLTFNMKTCGFVVLSLTNSSVLTGSASRRFSVNSGWYSIWECTNQKDCNVLETANLLYPNCNATIYYWLYWNKTSLTLHTWWTNAEFWNIPSVSHTWTTDLTITHIIKPPGSEYFQGNFEAPFAERCCPPNSTITDSKICTSEEQTSSTTAATTTTTITTAAATTTTAAAETTKLEMITESDTMRMTTDTTELTTNVGTDSITNSTRTGKSTVAVEVTSVAAFSDVNENNDKATSATRSSASPATAEGQEVTEAKLPDPSSTVVGTWSSSASTSLNVRKTTTPGSDTSSLPGNDIKKRLLCACRCLAKTPRTFPILNSLEANLTEEIKDSLILPKKQLSAQIRAKTSAPDARPSSVSAGVVAIAIISLVFFCLVVPDLLTLAQFLHGVLKADRRLTTM